MAQLFTVSLPALIGRVFRMFPRLFTRVSWILLLWGCVADPSAAGQVIRQAGVAVPGPGESFAIADFDGDQRPDFATIQGGRSSYSTEYWIELQFAGSAERSFRFDAPAGGLLIEARDVNGDHAVDLVLATAWLKEPVAILLNDGHGGFSRVEPAAFPRIFNRPGAGWTSSLYEEPGAIGCPPQTRDGLCLLSNDFSELRIHSLSLHDPRTPVVSHCFLASHAGRAPPSVAPHA
jgi:hypothetical protein